VDEKNLEPKDAEPKDAEEKSVDQVGLVDQKDEGDKSDES
jgi:hypothetical protein